MSTFSTRSNRGLSPVFYCFNSLYVKPITAAEKKAVKISAAPAANLGRKSFERFGGELSVLVKILDANERLFIQCHPTVEMAKKNFNSQFGKTECWIILEAEENACVYLGFKESISEEKWRSLFEAQYISGMLECMHRISVKRGDIVFVDGGMPHAIGGGCMMIEARSLRILWSFRSAVQKAE